MTLRYLMTSARRSVKANGVAETARLTRKYVGATFFPAESDETVRRFRLGQRLMQWADGVVAHGPFEGLRLSDNSWWGAADRGAMILGFYEKEVLEWLTDATRDRSTLVDLGAADGYYAVGALAAGLVDRVIAYEATAEGRAAITANARANGVGDRVVIRGWATDAFAEEVIAEGVRFDDSVVIIDVEGAEFDILTTTCLARLRGAKIIVELHEWHDGAPAKLNRILADARGGYTARFVVSGARDLSSFQVLRDWSDDDRWILCSEGRQRLMRWLILEPVDHVVV